eukprot:1902999-Pyramimonas_sp.AAC.1
MSSPYRTVHPMQSRCPHIPIALSNWAGVSSKQMLHCCFSSRGSIRTCGAHPEVVGGGQRGS